MEIIKNGKEKTFYARCGNCATELNYTLDEVKTEKSGSVLRDTIQYIMCPVCDEHIIVNLLTEDEVKEQANHAIPYGFCRGLG